MADMTSCKSADAAAHQQNRFETGLEQLQPNPQKQAPTSQFRSRPAKFGGSKWSPTPAGPANGGLISCGTQLSGVDRRWPLHGLAVAARPPGAVAIHAALRVRGTPSPSTPPSESAARRRPPRRSPRLGHAVVVAALAPASPWRAGRALPPASVLFVAAAGERRRSLLFTKKKFQAPTLFPYRCVQSQV
jgi:hypothetical protein